jgi:hypothetical protein
VLAQLLQIGFLAKGPDQRYGQITHA